MAIPPAGWRDAGAALSLARRNLTLPGVARKQGPVLIGELAQDTKHISAELELTGKL